MISTPKEGGLKEERDSEDNIIIIDSTLRNILPTQLMNMTSRYKIMCGCECYISAKSMHLYLLTWCECHIEHLKAISHNAQIEGLVNYQVIYLKYHRCHI